MKLLAWLLLIINLSLCHGLASYSITETTIEIPENGKVSAQLLHLGEKKLRFIVPWTASRTRWDGDKGVLVMEPPTGKFTIAFSVKTNASQANLEQVKEQLTPKLFKPGSLETGKVSTGFLDGYYLNYVAKPAPTLEVFKRTIVQIYDKWILECTLTCQPEDRETYSAIMAGFLNTFNKVNN